VRTEEARYISNKITNGGKTGKNLTLLNKFTQSVCDEYFKTRERWDANQKSGYLFYEMRNNHHINGTDNCVVASLTLRK